MVEELKKKAVEKVKTLKGLEFAKGREHAFKMIAEGKISLEDIETHSTIDAQSMAHELRSFLGCPECSVAFLEGFVQGLSEAS